MTRRQQAITTELQTRIDELQEKIKSSKMFGWSVKKEKAELKELLAELAEEKKFIKSHKKAQKDLFGC